MLLEVRVHPGSKKEKMIREGNKLEIWVNEKPEKGKANLKLIKLIAKEFNVSERDVKIVSGLTSRKKVVEIRINNSPKE